MRIYTLLLSILLVAAISACSPKVVEVVKEEPKEEPKIKTVDNPCITFDEVPPARRDKVETAYVLYRDFIKVKDYAKAIPQWEVAYYGAPASNGRVKYQFDDGVKIYTHLYKEANTAEDKARYVDSVMSVYDKRVECFGEKAYIQGRKAFDLYYSFPGHATDAEIFALFRENLESKGDKADYFIINPMTKLLHDGLTAGTIPYDEGQVLAKQLMKTIKYGQQNCKGQLCKAWQTIAEYSPVRLESLEGLDGFYDCEYYTEKYFPIYQQDPTCYNVELAYRRMLRGGCLETDDRIVELKEKKATDCYKPPPAPGLLRQAFDAYNAGKYTEAVDIFGKFVNKTDDDSKKFKYTMLIAKIYYRDIRNYPASRKYALEAAQYNSASGEPYLLIGKLYASSGPLCGPGTGWDSQIVTWPAIDMFSRATSDPETSTEARKLITQYRKYMPSQADLFQRRMKEGQSFKVPCWIQETTTVRAAK